MKKAIIFLVCSYFIVNCYSQNLEQGLVAYYPLDNNTKDMSKNGQDGKPISVTPAKGVNGAANSAYYFDGEESKIQIESTKLLNITGSITISCWIAPEAISQWDAWVSKMNGKHSSQWRVGFGTNPKIEWGLTTWNKKWDDCWIKNNIPANKWSFVTVTYDNAKGKISYYVNDKLVSSVNKKVTMLASNDPVFIGHQKDDNAFFCGIIDEVRIYNRSISDAEVKALYSKYSAKIVPPQFPE